MNELEKMIQKQNELVQNLNYPGKLTIVSALKNNDTFRALNVKPEMITSFYDSSTFRWVEKESKKIHNIIGAASIRDSFLNYKTPCILGDYNGIADLTRISRQMASVFEPISLGRLSIKNITQVLGNLTQLSPVLECIWKEPSLLENLHSAIGNQIDISLWDYYDSIDEIEEEIINQITEIIKAPDMKGRLRQFIEEKGEKGKQIIIFVIKRIIIFFVTAFFCGLVSYCCEPVYKVITPLFFHREENENSEEVVEIPRDTEIHVWGDTTKNFIEITYQANSNEYHGYITKEELDNKTVKISEGVELEHIIFINDVVELLAEQWNTEPELVYSFLNERTDILNTYILKHYDVLKYLDEEDVIDVIEKYCEDNGIDLCNHITKF